MLPFRPSPFRPERQAAHPQVQVQRLTLTPRPALTHLMLGMALCAALVAPHAHAGTPVTLSAAGSLQTTALAITCINGTSCWFFPGAGPGLVHPPLRSFRT